MVLVGHVGAILSLFVTLTPRLFIALYRVCSSLGLPRHTAVLEEVYSNLPPINFSQEILARSSHHLGVLPVKGIYWNDWGNPEQVRYDITRFGSRREAWCIAERGLSPDKMSSSRDERSAGAEMALG